MPGDISKRVHRPRELRRRVIASARLRRPRGWCDATILNISSRGLQIQTSWPLDEGSWIELRRGEHVIRAQVVWNKGLRAGLLADKQIAVEELASLDTPAGVRPHPAGERRRQPRAAERNRWRGRTIEFTGVIGIMLILAAGLFDDFQQAFARPLAAVELALR